MSEVKKVVLAYSGGLDTLAKYLWSFLLGRVQQPRVIILNNRF